jgi:hypothetical protein
VSDENEAMVFKCISDVCIKVPAVAERFLYSRHLQSLICCMEHTGAHSLFGAGFTSFGYALKH